MKNLFKKYLREKHDGETLTFSWYRLSFLDVIGIFSAPMLIMYLIGEQLHWKEVWGLKIIPFNLTARIVMYSIVLLLLLYLTLNRRSVLTISSLQVRFQRRLLTGKKWHFSKNEIVDLRTRPQKTFYENDVGLYPDTYYFSIILNSGKTIRVGTFNKEDCERLKQRLA